MPTRIQPYRPQYIASGGTWTNPDASPSTQTFYLPFYQMRNTPLMTINNYVNTMTKFVSAANRQQMANNGYYAEVDPSNPLDGPLWQSLRYTRGNWLNGGLTGSGHTAINGDTQKNGAYSRWIGAMLHEYAFAEMDIFFATPPSGQTDVHPFNWPAMVTLHNDCLTDSNNTLDAGTGFFTQLRVGTRVENNPFTTAAIPFNATAAQVQAALEGLSYSIIPGDVSVSGGPLPGTAISVTFTGQYAAHDIAQMTTASSLSGTSPTVTVTTTTNGTKAWAAPYNITAVNEVQQISMGGTVTSGTFTLSFAGGVDRPIEQVGPGTTTGTPQSRVDRWNTLCTNNGWIY